MSGVSNKAGQAKLASLRDQLAEARIDYNDEQFNHELDVRSAGYDKLKEDATKALETITDNVKRQTELQNQVISEMLASAQQNYTEVYGIINSTITENGLVVNSTTSAIIESIGSTGTNLTNLALKYGEAKAAGEAFTTQNDLANASIINTSDAVNSAVEKLIGKDGKGGLKSAYDAIKTAATQATEAVKGLNKVTAELPTVDTKTSTGTSNSSNTSSSNKTTTTNTSKSTSAIEQMYYNDSQNAKTSTTLPGSASSSSSNVSSGAVAGSTTSEKDFAKKYIKANANKASKKKSSYSDLNKKIYEMTNGKVLSTSEMKTLAKWLGVKYNNQSKTGTLYKKLHSLKVFAKGSGYIPQDQLGWTQDAGQELIFHRSDGAILTPLGRGDKVFTAEMTDNLWQLSKSLTKDGIARNVTDTTKNMTINNDPKLTITIDNLVNVEGNADQNTIDEIARIADERIGMFEKRVIDGMKVKGWKMKF